MSFSTRKRRAASDTHNYAPPQNKGRAPWWIEQRGDIGGNSQQNHGMVEQQHDHAVERARALNRNVEWRETMRTRVKRKPRNNKAIRSEVKNTTID